MLGVGDDEVGKGVLGLPGFFKNWKKCPNFRGECRDCGVISG